jgi:apolipoprotein D and lipocalin family protein
MQLYGLLIASLLMGTHAYTYVSDLNLNQYSGKWHEVYEDLFDQTFQKGGSCVAADYTLLDDGTVGVVNTEIYPNGTTASITGTAYYEKGHSGGQLTVDLEGAPMGGAPYWVVELGPVVKDKYDYAIVSDNAKISLFVLARDVNRFFERYDRQVLDSVEDMGFTRKYNMPVLVNQTHCA